MPSRDTVKAFVAAVESGDHVGAIERYYHADASMQENQNPPRVGIDALVANEKRALARATIVTHPARHVLVDGDMVVINWIFDMTDKEGRTRRLEELSIQEWRGEKIFREQFYYDAKQLA